MQLLHSPQDERENIGGVEKYLFSLFIKIYQNWQNTKKFDFHPF